MSDLFKTGANEDFRTQAEKDKDYQLRELVASANPVIWKEKPQAEWRKFPIFFQDSSGSCVAQSQAKELGIMRWLRDGIYVHFSATDIYQRRINKPNTGMAAVDARKVAQKGVTLEVLTPSQSMSDQAMDEAVVEDYKRKVGEIFAVSNYIELPVGDIETVASVIQTTKKGVMVWFYFDLPEWTNVPTILNGNLQLDKALRHAVVAVDYVLYNGKKALVIEDSWGSSYGIAGQRIITEDFFKVRNWYSGHLMNFRFEVQPMNTPTNDNNRITHTFLSDMEFGMKNEEIKALQICLRYEGVYPMNVEGTGYFGAMTKESVQKFQVKYGIAAPGVIGYGRVGPKTRAKLNQIFS